MASGEIPVHRIRKGLDLPLAGAPEQAVRAGPPVGQVALVGADYPGLRPKLAVQAGTRVRRGELLFEDGAQPGVRFTAPGAGQVFGIHRGERRVLQSVAIAIDSEERAGGGAQVEFASFAGKSPGRLDAREVRALLVESGMWTALRARPFGHVPAPESVPAAIFVTAIDTQPHAPHVDVALAGREEDFAAGLTALETLTPGTVHLCRAPRSHVDPPPGSRAKVAEFGGPHPAGTPGLHIHLLAPVGSDRTVWHVGYQDVAAIGALLATGRLDVTRVVAIAGPGVKRPRLLRTRLGAAIDDLVRGELISGEIRVVSGSVLAGRTASGPAEGYLGRYHLQISALVENRRREFLGWLAAGWSQYSATNAFASSLTRQREYALTTASHGPIRPNVPIGSYSRVMPFDIEPVFLLRALAIGDLEQAEALGALELEEEDLALCTFVSPDKHDYGVLLRNVLDQLRKEG